MAEPLTIVALKKMDLFAGTSLKGPNRERTDLLGSDQVDWAKPRVADNVYELDRDSLTCRDVGDLLRDLPDTPCRGLP